MKHLAAARIATLLLAGSVLAGCTNREADRTQENPPAADNSRPAAGTNAQTGTGATGSGTGGAASVGAAGTGASGAARR